jgi:hypothetical protein
MVQHCGLKEGRFLKGVGVQIWNGLYVLWHRLASYVWTRRIV